eukprot:1159891-Pelagomonas_calceolata.AAC.6
MDQFVLAIQAPQRPDLQRKVWAKSASLGGLTRSFPGLSSQVQTIAENKTHTYGQPLPGIHEGEKKASMTQEVLRNKRGREHDAGMALQKCVACRAF